MNDNIDKAPTGSAAGSSASCLIMKLPPELRQIIYEYYFEDRRLPRLRRLGSHIDPFNRVEIRSTGILSSYFGLLHYSSGVRAENVQAIYKAHFTGVWLLCDISDQHAEVRRTIELKRTR